MVFDDKQFYNKEETASILRVNGNAISRLIKQGKLKLLEETKRAKKITLESILSYQKELEERRNIIPAKWLQNTHSD